MTRTLMIRTDSETPKRKDKPPTYTTMSKLALVFDEKHLAQLKCALACNIADPDHELFHAARNAKPVAELGSCKMQEEDADAGADDDDDDRRFVYGDIVGPRSCRHRSALDRDELYIVVTDECRAVGHTNVEVIPFSACTSRESALQQRKCVDVAYLALKIAADARKLFTVTDVVSEKTGKVLSYNVLAPSGELAASFHDFEGSNGMAEEFAERFCTERNEACLLEDNEDYELIFPTEEELEQLEYTPTYEQ